MKSGGLLLPVIPESVPLTVLPENAKLKDCVCSLNRPSHTSLLEALTNNMLAGTLYSPTSYVITPFPVFIVAHSLFVVVEVGNVVLYLFGNISIRRTKRITIFPNSGKPKNPPTTFTCTPSPPS